MISLSSMVGSQGLVTDGLKKGFKLEAKQFTSLQRASKVQSLRLAKITSYTGKFLGVAGALTTAYEGYEDGHLSAGDWAKIGVNTVMIFTPYGWAYGLVDLGVGFATGTTLTDRIGSGFDSAFK